MPLSEIKTCDPGGPAVQSRVRTLRGRLARLPQPSVASDDYFWNNAASMRGSTNRSSCESTVASPSAFSAMSFIVIHRIFMNKKRRKRPRWWVMRLFRNGL
jgi:hypothetical protein